MVRVLGSNKSAGRLKADATSSLGEPPSNNTLPLGRMTAFISILPADMGAFVRVTHAGVAAEKSMISVEAVAGLPPPAVSTLALYPSSANSGRRTVLP